MNTRPWRARDARDLVHEVERARLVGLHGEAEAAPLRMFGRDARRERLQHVEREFEAIAFLGVDREVDVGARGALDELPDARQQHGEHAFALAFLVAREQGTELDRDAVGGLRPPAPGAPSATRAAAMCSIAPRYAAR